MKVVIIEDNPINRELTAELMKSLGYEVFPAENAEKGITIVREELPSLILMDIQLPGMDGMAATRLLKDDEKTKHIPIIALTAYAMSGDREKIMESGCDAYMDKPIRCEPFIKMLDDVLKK